MERKINTLMARVWDQINLPESQTRLNKNMAKLEKICTKIDIFMDFHVNIKKGWSEI